MSKILSPGQAEILTAEKRDLLDKSLEAKTQGESDRLSKQVMDIQRQLDDDLNERRRTGFDEARNRAAGIIAGTTTGVEDMTAGPTPEQLREFTRPVDTTKPMQQSLSIPIDIRRIEQRLEYPLAVGDTSNTYGADAMSVSVTSAVLAGLVGQSAILDAGPKIFRTPTSELLVVPTAADITAAYRAEANPATQDTVVMSKLELSGFHLAGYTEVTSEFEQSALNGGGPAFIGELCGRALGVKTATELAVGSDSGSTICGAFHAPTVGVTSGATTSYTYADLIALRQSVSPAARRNGRWVFSDAAMTLALQLTDENGNTIIKPGANADGADVLMGQKCGVDAYGPALTATQNVVLYGDFSNSFVVRFVGNLEITRSDTAGTTEFVSWISVYRYQVTLDAGYITSDVKSLKTKT